MPWSEKDSNAQTATFFFDQARSKLFLKTTDLVLVSLHSRYCNSFNTPCHLPKTNLKCYKCDYKTVYKIISLIYTYHRMKISKLHLLIWNGNSILGKSFQCNVLFSSSDFIKKMSDLVDHNIGIINIGIVLTFSFQAFGCKTVSSF